MKSNIFKRILGVLSFIVLCTVALAQQLSFVGNSSLYNTGVGQMPTLGGFIEPYQSLSITTQTYPISSGQSVSLIYTTDDWQTSHTMPFTFNYNVGNNSQWYAVLGPLPQNTDVLFYIQASSTNGTTLYDNNNGQNYGFISRIDPQPRRGAILQWFATPYSVMLQRLPEVAAAGYGALYLPPPEKAGGGGLSVGYNPFDRFDLGDRSQSGSIPTQYGTTEQFQQVVQLAHRLGLEVYVDSVLNHNDNRASTNIASYPDMIPEDFHIFSTANPTNSQINYNNNAPFTLNMLNGDLAGLADIAHEDGNLTETGPFDLPSYASFNSYGKPSFVRQPLDPQLYPNFKPTAEDVRQYLLRWCGWLVGDLGIDGMRFDAVREIDPGFFDTVNTQGGFQVHNGNLIPYLVNLDPNFFAFGEDDNSDSYEFREYLKTGIDLLDFPLFNTIGNVFNSNGYGNLGQTLTNSYGLDPTTSTPYETGGLGTDVGVSFVQSHDYGPPTSSNLAYAFTMTRGGSTIVYYDGNNLDPFNYNQFPKPGRYDALGYQDSIVTSLVDARARFGRGNLVERYATTNLDVYDREVNGVSVMLVGLNNRGDLTPLSATVQTAFPAGTILHDLTGQEQNVTVGSNQTISITVPSNSTSTNSNNAEGYVVYVPITPSLVSPIVVENGLNNFAVSPTTINLAAGKYGGASNYQEYTLTKPNLSLQVNTDIAATCLVKVDNGVQLPGTTLYSNSPEGLADGFFPMTSLGNGSFSINNLDFSQLPDGIHLFRIRAFDATGNNPGLFTDFCIYVDIDRTTLGSINGDLSKYGNPIVTQSVAPSSQSNRLDEMFVTNDDQYLYIGLAGQVNGSNQYTNGVVTMLDLHPGVSDGYSNFNLIKDDYGPAGRLLSNSALIAPTGFQADAAIVSFQGDTINGAPGAPISGDVSMPAKFGASEGAFLLNPGSPALEVGIPSKIAWQPRSNPFGPQIGMEVAIPLTSLFSSTIALGSSIDLLSYITTTGENGQTLNAYDPSRGTLGGRPKPMGYVLNQFLPPQNGINIDPGTKLTSLSNFVNYKLLFVTTQAGLVTKALPMQPNGNGTFQSTITVSNFGTQTISGPFFIVINTHNQGTVIGATGNDFRIPGDQYIKFNRATLPPHYAFKLMVDFTSKNGFPPNISVLTLAGKGIP